jgi:hypothetical protein
LCIPQAGTVGRVSLLVLCRIRGRLCRQKKTDKDSQKTGDPEQLKAEKRKNLVYVHRHRDKRKKIQYPHLNTIQPTPKPTKK